MYTEPCEEKPCSKCVFRMYDSFHNELWCNHDPKPDGVGSRSLIDNWGSCEYWMFYLTEKQKAMALDKIMTIGLKNMEACQKGWALTFEDVKNILDDIIYSVQE